VIESLRPDVTQRYLDFGLDFYSPDEVLGSNLFRILDRAVHIISGVRGAALTVSAVLSVVHILKPESAEYDISYSEPTLPFSIFVGIDPGWQANRDLRVAESILHECMHLQLTLIEDQMLLIAADNEHHLSPWRQALRPTRGVLHALYVFRVIQDFFSAVLASISLSADEHDHIRRRLNGIDAEVEQMGDLSVSQDLTPAGRALVARLQIGNKFQV
jgi:HEXXH motif-containing protein